MLQCRRESYLSLEVVDTDPIGDVGMQDFDGHRPAQFYVPGKKHHARSAKPKSSVYNVPLGELRQ